MQNLLLKLVKCAKHYDWHLYNSAFWKHSNVYITSEGEKIPRSWVLFDSPLLDVLCIRLDAQNAQRTTSNACVILHCRSTLILIETVTVSARKNFYNGCWLINHPQISSSLECRMHTYSHLTNILLRIAGIP